MDTSKINCRVIEVEQGSDQWLAERRGRITCSRLADVMAKPTTKRYKQYRREIVQELLGYESVEESPEWAAHGREQEPRALGAYQYQYQVELEHDAILIHPVYDWLACSPDFLVAPTLEEGGEVKCRKLYKNYRKYRMLEKCPPENRHQVQGAMWVTDFLTWKYVNYYEGPDMDGVQQRKIHSIDVYRDQDFIDAMEIRCMEFMLECKRLAGTDQVGQKP